MSKYQISRAQNEAQCLICPRQCNLSEGNRGFCHVRQNISGEVRLTTYGHTTGLAVDPIEKKPLYHFYPGSKVLSFGTLGCNMGCLFCQNWSSSKSKLSPEKLPSALPDAIADAAQRYQCQSVAFTYNEPTVFYEYALDTAKACRELGIKTVAVTAGYINPEPRDEFYQFIDAVNVDLKGFSSDFYQRNCQANLEVVLDTIRYLNNETDVWLELTTLLIEGENDSEDDIKKECDWLVSNIGETTPIHFSAFRPAWKFQDRPQTKLKTLLNAYHIAKESGLKHVYTGNVYHEESSVTYCESCGRPVIVRGILQTKEIHLEGNCCAFCHAPLSGRFPSR